VFIQVALIILLFFIIIINLYLEYLRAMRLKAKVEIDEQGIYYCYYIIIIIIIIIKTTTTTTQ